jgi:hypothetical protein
MTSIREIGVKIGTLTITEAGEPVTENHTRYAADLRTYTVKPGTYDARLYDGSVYITVDVEQTSETLVSSLMGYSKSNTDDTVRDGIKTYMPYDYELARVVATEDQPTYAGGAFHLDDGWTVQVKHHTFPARNGQPERHYTGRKFAKIA